MLCCVPVQLKTQISASSRELKQKIATGKSLTESFLVD